jgi:hypothetical protein
MSPVAAAFASPCKAFGDCPVVVVDGTVVVVGNACFAAPQAATRRQTGNRIKTRFTIST